MELTPEQFAGEVDKWYWKWRNANSGYFSVEQQLTQKATNKGFLEMADLVAITHVLGNPHNIRGRVQRENTNEQIKQKTQAAINNLHQPSKALANLRGIRWWGGTYRTKTLRCVCPRNYAALDSKLNKNISESYLKSKNELRRYEEFLDLCKSIRQKVSTPGPRLNKEWFIADIEMALFQFVWDGGKIV